MTLKQGFQLNIFRSYLWEAYNLSLCAIFEGQIENYDTNIYQVN